MCDDMSSCAALLVPCTGVGDGKGAGQGEQELGGRGVPALGACFALGFGQD